MVEDHAQVLITNPRNARSLTVNVSSIWTKLRKRLRAQKHQLLGSKRMANQDLLTAVNLSRMVTRLVTMLLYMLHAITAPVLMANSHAHPSLARVIAYGRPGLNGLSVQRRVKVV